jgi:SAM-dependent methyltransferase
MLRRTTPISRVFAYDRGMPIDRYYMESFLSRHRLDISGRVLEIGDPYYTKKFGGDRVTASDVLHYVPDAPHATIIADMTCADVIPSNTFDCIILTQTLQMIFDFRAAMQHIHRILKPGGVLLLTSGNIAKIARREGVDPWGEYWHFTSQSLRRIFLESFPEGNTTITVYGNVFAATAFLHGLAAEELHRDELDYLDPDFEVLNAVRAVKPGTTNVRSEQS